MSVEIVRPISVLIGENQFIFALGLKSCIESYGEAVRLVGVAEDGLEAVSMAGDLDPHVILMDIHLSKLSGFEATKNIKKSFPHIEVIILSDDNFMKNINDALKAGASGYLLKSVTGDRLLAAIQDVARGGSAFSPEVSQRLISILRNPSLEMTALTAGERKILDCMADGWTNEKISDTFLLSVSTVEIHALNILHKIGVSLQNQAVTNAVRSSLV